MRKQIFRLSVLVVLLIDLACAVQESTADPIVRMYRATPLQDTDGWEERVRRELGCDPCGSFVEEADEGDRVVFLFNPTEPLSLEASEIVSATIGRVNRVRQPYILILHLSQAGIERVNGYRGDAETAMAVNEIDGEIVGMSSLWTSGDDYLFGWFADLGDAKRVASKLGVPVRVSIAPSV